MTLITSFRAVAGVEQADIIARGRGVVGRIVRIQPTGKRKDAGQRTVAYDVDVDGVTRRVPVEGDDWRSARLTAHEVAREMVG